MIASKTTISTPAAHKAIIKGVEFDAFDSSDVFVSAPDLGGYVIVAEVGAAAGGGAVIVSSVVFDANIAIVNLFDVGIEMPNISHDL